MTASLEAFSDSVAVKPSRIHGQGLYASRRFTKGEIVLTWNSSREISQKEFEALPEEDRRYVVDRGALPLLLIGKPERYVNHSCAPNTTNGERCDIALRDIEIGEEITTDYADAYIRDGSMKCSCGSPHCRGGVTGKSPVVKDKNSFVQRYWHALKGYILNMKS